MYEIKKTLLHALHVSVMPYGSLGCILSVDENTNEVETTFLHLHGLSQSCLSFMSRHSSCNGSGLRKCNAAYTYTK